MTTDQLIAALLRDEPVNASDIRRTGGADLLAAATAHDVVPLVAERLQQLDALPADVRQAFATEAHAAAAADLGREAELRRVLVAFDSAGIDLLLMKGSHLAYSHYARPDLRARIDSDLLIERNDRDRADDLLTRELGYAAEAKVSGDLTATQKLYVLTRDGADVHLIDLHWRLTSPQAFAHVLSFDELRSRAVPLPSLGPAARGPSNVHALLIACTHRVAHHHDEADQFKWLYDIHLVASGLTAAEWRELADFSTSRGVAAVLLEGLERSRAWFGTPVPEAVQKDPRLMAATRHERTAAFLHVRPKAREVLDDFRALSSWRDRLQLAKEHLLPDADYMRTVYAPNSRQPLPWLYLRRLWNGAGRWLQHR